MTAVQLEELEMGKKHVGVHGVREGARNVASRRTFAVLTMHMCCDARRIC